jgi:acetyl-CoA acyltransferase
MAQQRRTFIAGGVNTPFIGRGHPDFIWKRHPDFGKKQNPGLEEMLREVVNGAIADTGVDPAAIDRLYLGNFVGELFCNQGHLGAALAGSHPAFAGKPSSRLEGACASGGLAVLAGIDAIRAGVDAVLVVGVEMQTTQSARVGADYLARASHYRRQRGIDDFTFPALFAKRTQAYRAAFGVSEEDIGRVAVKAYANANCNPLAHMKARKMSLEIAREASDKNPCFLGNEALSPYIKISDCSQVSDGASAILLVSEAGLAALGRIEADAVEIAGTGHATASLYEDGDLTRLDSTQTAVGRAYAEAGIGPERVNVAEVHDCFTVTELTMLEALGLAKLGQGAALTRDGATARDGSVPVNTGGGLIGFGHPVGATGVKQPLELFRQMKGLCGDYQIPVTPEWGITANMGGDDKTVVSLAIHNLS